jgi:predicted DNA-binding transcriptional regulator AlpA
MAATEGAGRPAGKYTKTSQIARFLGVSKHTVERMVLTGAIPRPRRFGRMLFWETAVVWPLVEGVLRSARERSESVPEYIRARFPEKYVPKVGAEDWNGVGLRVGEPRKSRKRKNEGREDGA